MLKISVSLILLSVLFTGCGSNSCCNGDMSPIEEEGSTTVQKLLPTSVISSLTNECVEGGAITFDGRSSDDADGFIRQYEWLIDGKEAATTPVPSFACENVGEKKVCLKVIDDNGLSSSYVCQTFTVKPKEVIKIPPSAVIEASKFCTLGETIRVDGTKSTDSDGEVVYYLWHFDDALSNFDKPYFQCAKEGVQNLCLEVTDNDGLKDENCTVVIGQQIPNKPPVAKIVTSSKSCIVGEHITLDAGESKDEDGFISHFNWKPDAPDASAMDFTCEDAGIHKVCVTVVDNKGLNSTQVCEEIAISKPANQIPVAKVEVLPQSCSVGETILADATTSFDPDGNITAYLWSIDQNQSASNEPKPIFTCDKEGSKHICLQVTDNEGAISENEACQDVTVNPKPNATIPPVAMISVTKNIDTTPSVTADCVGSYDPDTIDGDNNPQNDGKVINPIFTVSKTYTNGFTEDPHQGTCPKWISTPPDLQSMTITLTVTDDDGETTSKTNIYDWDGTSLILRKEG